MIYMHIKLKQAYIYIYVYIYIYIYWRLGGESNREIDFGFVFVHVSCVRAKLCARIPLWLGAAKLFCAAPPAPALVGGRTSRDVPRDVPPGRRAGRRAGRRVGRRVGRAVGRRAGRRVGRRTTCGTSRGTSCVASHGTSRVKKTLAARRCDTDAVLM